MAAGRDPATPLFDNPQTKNCLRAGACIGETAPYRPVGILRALGLRALANARWWASNDHHQAGATLGRITRADRASMGKRYLACEAETDAAAALMGSVEGQEDVLAPVRREAGAVVPHLDADATVALAADR